VPPASHSSCRRPLAGTASSIMFDPIEALRHSAGYLRELRDRFGNLGLAAAAYNAGPGRVSAWLTSHRSLPGETRNYVAIITGWTADEWASGSPLQTADTTIPQGVPCTRPANLILAPKEEAKRIATYMPRWGIWLAAHLVGRRSAASCLLATGAGDRGEYRKATPALSLARQPLAAIAMQPAEKIAR
jgi:hypothetical protein